MKLKSFDTAIFRVPQFPISTPLHLCWNELKQAIKISSPDFYDHIENLEFDDISRQSPNIKFTIEKYFNRSRFRATPYGLFANIGICTIGGNNSNKLLIGNQKIVHSFIDWQKIASRKQAFNKHSISEYCFQTNTLFYKIGDQLRYIYKEGDKFELSELQYDQRVVDILEFCKMPKTFNEVEIQLCSKLDMSDHYELIQILVDHQLLYTNLQGSIIADAIECRSALQASSYIIGQRPLISGGLDTATIKAIENVIQKLSCCPSEKSESQLDNFKRSFSAKYDQEFIPIMEALDPEMGIGYGGMERSSQFSELIEEISNSKNSTVQDNDWLKGLKSDILYRGIQDKTEIDVLKYLPKEMDHVTTLPNTFNAFLRFYNNKPVIEQIDGYTATSLLGRFSLADVKISTFCKQIASIEQQCNPEVAFCDIAYCGEAKVDNINRRQPLYNYQIDIYNFNNIVSPIPVSNILIGIRNKEVVLYAKNLGKRIIPRLSTAYNYSRSDLPIFRLLCDIQGQGLKSSLIPDFTVLFEDQEYIPQINIGEAIIQPASWVITMQKEWEDLSSFQAIVSREGKYKYIKIGEADQTLMLGTDCFSDLQLLLSILVVRKKLRLQDALYDNNQLVVDEDKNQFCSEFILSFYHENQIYNPIVCPLSSANTVQRSFLPGSEWLYFEIYSHTNVVDRILMVLISDILGKNKTLVKSWFFIRYDEGGDHIRLRIKPAIREQTGFLIEQVQTALNNPDLYMLIKDLKICTYKRELERYGFERIERVEQLFANDSEFIFNHLLHETDVYKYRCALQLILNVGSMIFGDDLFNNLKLISKDHNLEHNLNGKLFKKINTQFKNVSAQCLEPTFLDKMQPLLQCYVECLTVIPENMKLQMFRDLIHMHINRLFCERQRVHEAIIYNHCFTAYREMKHNPKFQLLPVNIGST